MKRIARVGTLEEQDRLRRESMREMAPDNRLAMLLAWRDGCFTDCGPIVRQASFKQIPWPITPLSRKTSETLSST